MYKDKKLPNIIKTLQDFVPLNCLIVCLETDSCYAVNVGVANGNALCELTGGLSNQDEMQNNIGSSLHVLGKFLNIKCIIQKIHHNITYVTISLSVKKGHIFYFLFQWLVPYYCFMIVDYNKCEQVPGYCQNGGTCIRQWTSASCSCQTGYFGDICDNFLYCSKCEYLIKSYFWWMSHMRIRMIGLLTTTGNCLDCCNTYYCEVLFSKEIILYCSNRYTDL